jgi:hypothetical protein
VKIAGPLRAVDELELARLSSVHSINESRLDSSIGHGTPLLIENQYYRETDRRGLLALGQLAFH